MPIYIIMPIMSLVMDMNGPVAMAGSTFSFSRSWVPTFRKWRSEHDNGEQTDGYRVGNCGRTAEPYKLYMYTSKDMMVALIAATTDSFGDFVLNVSLASKELLASPCTINCRGLGPTFPPVPPIRGMYSAISGCAAKVASKLPNIMELPIPPSIPISNHGRRAEVWRMTLSSVSTSCDKPDANW